MLRVSVVAPTKEAVEPRCAGARVTPNPVLDHLPARQNEVREEVRTGLTCSGYPADLRPLGEETTLSPGKFEGMRSYSQVNKGALGRREKTSHETSLGQRTIL